MEPEHSTSPVMKTASTLLVETCALKTCSHLVERESPRSVHKTPRNPLLGYVLAIHDTLLQLPLFKSPWMEPTRLVPSSRAQESYWNKVVPLITRHWCTNLADVDVTFHDAGKKCRGGRWLERHSNRNGDVWRQKWCCFRQESRRSSQTCNGAPGTAWKIEA